MIAIVYTQVKSFSDILESIHSKNFLKMSNIEILLLFVTVANFYHCM